MSAALAAGHPLRVTDGRRSVAEQDELARRKPGKAVSASVSRHVTGFAVDVEGTRDDAAAMRWVTANAARFGLRQPALYKGEPYHLELAR